MEPLKTRPKNRGRFRLFRCCTISQDDVASPRLTMKRTDPLLTYIAVAETRPMTLPNILSSALTVAKGGAGEGSPSRRKKMGKDKSLRQALVAAFNHTSLAKRISSRRKTSKGYLSKSSSSNFEGEESEKSSYIERNSSNVSTVTHGSGSTPTHASGSLQINGDGKNLEAAPNVPLCFLFIASLVVLIMWGKFCAIVCTSTGFFVVSRRRRKPSNEGAKCGYPSKSVSFK